MKWKNIRFKVEPKGDNLEESNQARIQKNEVKNTIEKMGVLGPPLYIGMADNLQSRYSQHVLQGKSQRTKKAKNFSHRLNQFLQRFDIKLAIDDIIFAYVEMDLEKEDIRALENFLIRAIMPPFNEQQ